MYGRDMTPGRVVETQKNGSLNMTRNPNNVMRQMAVTGLAMFVMVLVGAGTVGCDRLDAGLIAQLGGASGAAVAQVADADGTGARMAANSKVIVGMPPRSRVIHNGPPTK